ncbi:hypothetical protein PPN31114_00772 [Pandoraea pneumonica]|jgi:hypothetical protein|uniref:Uncharacterized protein n=1 Tax=Pandoraea pneumonica TaxID=2508299 RepID=A0A5E4SEW5_9BURK|nr:hypothetical protein [Pandoraea pneumonica]VVD74197.1 hypothetical protein PPN31114_00772 [Pandoraea pneumonica]
MFGKSLPQVRRLPLCAAFLVVSLTGCAGLQTSDTASSANASVTAVAQAPSARTLQVAAILGQQRDLELKRLSP